MRTCYPGWGERGKQLFFPTGNLLCRTCLSPCWVEFFLVVYFIFIVPFYVALRDESAFWVAVCDESLTVRPSRET
jgi:hypothetical protein